MVEIKLLENDAFDNKQVDTLKEEYEPIVSDIIKTLNSRLMPSDKYFLKSSLKALQTKTSLSIELIRYFLLSEKWNHQDAIKFLFTNYGKLNVKPEMRRFTRFLREEGILVERKMGYYKRLLNYGNNLKKFKVSRFIHSFRI